MLEIYNKDDHIAKDFYLLSGLFIEGAKLDENNQIRELKASETLVQELPLVVLRTYVDKSEGKEEEEKKIVEEAASSLCTDSEDSQGYKAFYSCPIYKTKERLARDVEPVGYIKL